MEFLSKLNSCFSSCADLRHSKILPLLLSVKNVEMLVQKGVGTISGVELSFN